jgi:hypothetical protein
MKEYLPKELEYDIVFNGDIQISKTGKFKILVDNTLTQQDKNFCSTTREALTFSPG